MVTVFVYGTLMKDNSNYNRYLAEAKYMGKYTAEGFALYDLGSYPGIIPIEGHRVKGELYSVDSHTLERLDMLEGEGSLYLRREILVVNDENQLQQAFTYIYNRDISKESRVSYENQPWSLKSKEVERKRNLVFAYGSLINRSEVIKTLKSEYFVSLGMGRIENYKLAFTYYSNKWQGGVLDIISSKGDYTLGLLLEVSDSALKAIDIREGVAANVYGREIVNVMINGKEVEAFVYTVVNKNLNGIKASEEYLEKVENAMKQEGFTKAYINKYLLGINFTEEEILLALRFLRAAPHAEEVCMIANVAGIHSTDTYIFIDHLVKCGYIRKHKYASVEKYDSFEKYFTVREKRQEIDALIEEDKRTSIKLFETIDYINSDLKHKTMVCMKCLTTYKDGKTFCRKCSDRLVEIDTPMLDIILNLNKKGYKTQFCCSGHPEKGFYYAYFIIIGSLNGIPEPEGFTFNYKNSTTVVSSKNINKTKSKLSTQELEVLIKKNLLHLREWVKLLP